MKFYVGVPDAYMAQHVGPCMVSVNRLRRRVSDFEAGEWVMDSGAFTEQDRPNGWQFLATRKEMTHETRQFWTDPVPVYIIPCPPEEVEP